MYKDVINILIVVIFFISINLYFSFAEDSTSKIINIPDENLLKSVNLSLGRGLITDPVTIKDMEYITSLEANNSNIRFGRITICI